MTGTMWLDELKFDDRGLVPIVAQEIDTGSVLMLAYATREAIQRSVDTGQAHYWSRSRGELWRKGDTSGNSQEIVEIRPDCDGDAVLYRVRQSGPACHTGEPSCFYRKVEGGEIRSAASMDHILDRLAGMLAERERLRPAGSYTTYLFDNGLDKILKKVGEEATETVIAAKNQDAGELVFESADLVFHLMVLFRAKGVRLGEIWQELEQRFGAKPRAEFASSTRTPGE